MDDNWRIVIGYFCVALVLVAAFIGGAWILSPQEFTFKVEIDNNTKKAVESIDYSAIESASNNQNKCYEITIRWDRILDVEENTLISGSFYNTSWIETDCRKFNQDMINNVDLVATDERGSK